MVDFKGNFAVHVYVLNCKMECNKAKVVRKGWSGYALVLPKYIWTVIGYSLD
jgi:hypothetical protein